MSSTQLLSVRPMRRVCMSLGLAMILVAGHAPIAWAQDPFDPQSSFGRFTHQAKLTPGGRTAVAGDISLIAADGVVHVFERDPGTDTWAEVTQLTPGDSASNFGQAIAMDGTRAIVGAEGAAYVFRKRSNGMWREIAKLVPSDGIETFGFSVDIDGRHAIVGGRGPGFQSGAAYIFMRDTQGWREVRKLEPGSPVPFVFGSTVAVSGETAMVGAATGAIEGAAYIFGRHQGGSDNWGQVKRLPEVGGFFAMGSIDISGDTAMIGGGELNYFVLVFGRNRDGLNVWGRQTTYSGPDLCCGTVGKIEISGDKAILGIGGLGNEVHVLARNQGGANAWDRVSRFIPRSGVSPGLDPRLTDVSLEGDTALIASSSSDLDHEGVFVLVFDVDADGVRDGTDVCPRDPLNNAEDGCRRSSEAYPVLDDLAPMTDLSTSFTSPRRSVLTATFTNTSDVPIRNPFFEVTSIGNRSVLFNADGVPSGVGATLSPEIGDGILSPGETMTVEFVMRHPPAAAVELQITLRGELSP